MSGDKDISLVNDEDENLSIDQEEKEKGKTKKGKKFKKRWIFLGLLTLLTYQCLYPDPMFYFAKSIDAQVIDVDTGEPINDVVVVAFWLLDGGWEGGSNRGVVNVIETTSDAQGNFHFSGWGPKKIPHWFSWDARLKGDSPQILLYKKGYYPRQLRDRYRPTFFTSPFTDSSWDGMQVKMQRFEGDEQKHDDMIRRFNYVLDEIVRYKSSKCEWEKFPRMIIEARPEGRLRTSNLYDRLLGREERDEDQGCPSFTRFIKEYDSEESPEN